jgi:hypothetical protein
MVNGFEKDAESTFLGPQKQKPREVRGFGFTAQSGAGVPADRFGNQHRQ